MSHIVEQIDKAIGAHGAWKVKLGKISTAPCRWSLLRSAWITGASSGSGSTAWRHCSRERPSYKDILGCTRRFIKLRLLL